MKPSELIDRFVEMALQSGAQITAIKTAPWIEALEQKLAIRFPVSFHSLVSRYEFEPFEISDISFFGNTGTGSADEMTVAIFRDPIIAQITQTHGYIQFARLAGGSYNPICFDTNQKKQNHEYPIVQIDHEQMLIHDRIEKPALKAASFHHFVANVIENNKTK